VPVVQGTAEGL